MKLCPHCGAALPADAALCSACNTVLPPAPVPPGGEAQNVPPAEPVDTAQADGPLPGDGRIRFEDDAPAEAPEPQSPLLRRLFKNAETEEIPADQIPFEPETPSARDETSAIGA